MRLIAITLLTSAWMWPGSSGTLPDLVTTPPESHLGGTVCEANPSAREFLIDPTHPGARDDGAGSTAQPWKTLAALSRRDLEPGDLIRLRGGLYRGQMRPKVAGLVVEGCPGEEVIVTGAYPIRTEWRRTGQAWIAASYRPFPDAGESHDRNLIVADGELLMPASGADELVQGSYHIKTDAYGGAELLVRLSGDRDPSGAVVEAGIHDVLFGPADGTRCEEMPRDEPGHTLRNLTFTHAANPAQTGAVCLWGIGASAEDLRILETNARGLETWGEEHQVRNVETSRNGHLGLGGGCRNCVFEQVQANNNNWRQHDPFWEAGGGKWVETSGTVFRDVQAWHNEGPGLWLDGDSHDNRIENARVHGNLVAGIQLELGSDRNKVTGSKISGTRRDGWSASGVLVMAASGSVLENNEITGNEGSGVWVRVDSRRPSGGISLVGNRFEGNAAHPGDHDYQVRIDMDVAPGSPYPATHLSGNLVDGSRPRHVAAIRENRDAPVERFDSQQGLIERLRAASSGGN